MAARRATALIVADDLMVFARLEFAARGAGLNPVPLGATTGAAAGGSAPGLILVALGHRRLDAVAFIAEQRAAAVAAGRSLPILAFGSHVDEERLEAARQAGADEVLPHSALVGDLAGRLRGHLERLTPPDAPH